MSQSELPGSPSARPVRAARYWWQRFLHNAPQKLLALLLACLVWYLATEDRRASIQQIYEVALESRDTIGSSEKRAVSSLSPATVRVTLSGTRQRLANLNASDIEAYVDVTGLPNGVFTRTVRVIGPDGTRSIKVMPTVAQGRIDAEISRTQPVTLSVTEPGGESVPRYLLSPRQATVSGPGQTVNDVDRVVTVPLNLSQGEQREAKLLALNAQGEPVNVRLTPTSVTVTRIDTGSLPMRSVPVRLSAPPSSLRVTASSLEPSTVRLIGPADILAGINSVSASVTYRAGTFDAQPSLDLPAGVRALDRVTARITAEPTAAGGP